MSTSELKVCNRLAAMVITVIFYCCLLLFSLVANAQSLTYPVSGPWAYVDVDDNKNIKRACSTFEKSRVSRNADDVTGTLIFFDKNKRFDYGGYINGYEHTVTSVQVLDKDDFRITERYYDDGEGGGKPRNKTRSFRIRLGADDRFQMIEGKIASAYVGCPGTKASNEKPKMAEANADVRVVAGDIVPLRRGYYVTHGTPCDQASNATLNLFLGNVFYKNCRVTDLARIGEAYRITQSCVERGERTRSTALYRVINPMEFSVTYAADDERPSTNSRYRYCAQSTLPEPFRSNEVPEINR